MPLIVLGRDGVINQRNAPHVRSPDDWHPIPGSIEAIARLNQAGYRVLVTTELAGRGPGTLTTADIDRIQLKLYQAVEAAGGRIDGVFFCAHQPEDGCECRKPEPGLLLDIAQRLNITLADVFVVGDSLDDVEAARAAGAKPVLVRASEGLGAERGATAVAGVPIYADLSALVDDLLGVGGAIATGKVVVPRSC